MTRHPLVLYAARFDAHCPNMTVTERFTTFRYAYPPKLQIITQIIIPIL